MTANDLLGLAGVVMLAAVTYTAIRDIYRRD